MQNRRENLDLSVRARMLATCTCLQMRKATRVITHMYDGALRPSGLLSTQLPLLVTLMVTGSASITELAEKLLIDRTTVTRNLRPLQVQGLIDITLGEDRRTRNITLTDRGRNAVAKAMPLWEMTQARVAQELGPELSLQLHEILSAVQSLAHRD